MSEQTEMNIEATEAQALPVLQINEKEKEWEIVGTDTVKNWEDFFMDAHNFKCVLEFAKERARNLVADPTTKDGQIARKALAKRIGQVEKAIADKGLEVARILKEKPKKIDAVRKTVKDTLLMYKEEVLAPLKEIEARQAEIVEITNLPAQGIGCDSEGIKDLLERLEAWKAKEWKESKDDADDAINETRRQLSDMLKVQEKAEADARELEELRVKEAEQAAKREEELRKAQAEAARLQHEKEEAERRAADAEKARQEAEKAKQEAEESRKATEAKLNDWSPKATKEEDLLFPEDEKERQRKIKTGVKVALMEILKDKLQGFGDGGYEEAAKAIVIAVAKGNVPHLVLDFRYK